MCGIFGLISPVNSRKTRQYSRTFKSLMRSSESRGKDCSGVLVSSEKEFKVFKSSQRGKTLLRDKIVQESLKGDMKAKKGNTSFVIAGHTRMVTHGSKYEFENIQPCISGDRFAIFHNGVITNWRELSHEMSLTNAHLFSDTKILALLLEELCTKESDIQSSLENILLRLSGANNFVILDSKTGSLFFFSSNGSLYTGYDSKTGAIVYASEKEILKKQLSANSQSSVKQVPKLQLIKLDQIIELLNSDVPKEYAVSTNLRIEINVHSVGVAEKNYVNSLHVETNRSHIQELMESIDYGKIGLIQRCKLCILPSTFPGLLFDVEGICELCKTHVATKPKGIEELRKLLARNGGTALIPISGGRDSSFALHYLSKELEVPVIAYTYDWGFVSNSARENISKMCGKLGIEHILIAANMDRKRTNVRKNLLAWLDKPEIGLVPILMAGDKQFLTLSEKIRKENGLGVSIFAMNSYEKTLFKSAYAGSTYASDERRSHSISSANKMRILRHYGLKFIQNRKYFNSSLIDSSVGFFSFYFVKTNYLQVFDYLEWDEREIMKILSENYAWSTENTGENSWRSGDATSGFYNFIYLKFGGFTENDTFRSNQIRNGAISRDEAIERIQIENRVQAEMILEYLGNLRINIDIVNRKLKGWGKFSS